MYEVFIYNQRKIIMTMLVEIIGAFSKGALTEEILVNGLVTDVGAGLYPYMIFLEHSERKVEAEMLREHRDAIFAVRDKFDQKTINKKEMAMKIKLEIFKNSHFYTFN